MRHLLVTNDFPPKIGGIQSYLWELWRRLPPEDVTVLTTPHPDAAAFDAEQPYRIERATERVLLPTPALRRRIDGLADEVDASFVVLDPALPLGLVGPQLARPYWVVLHGAEVAVPARLPASRSVLRRVLQGAERLLASGPYPGSLATEIAGPVPPVTVIPPGVDTERFTPLDLPARRAARASFGLPVEGPLVVSVSRLVPRKGMDVLIRAAGLLARTRPSLTVAIVGEGRDRRRLERLIDATGAPVRLLGRIPDDQLAVAYGCADVFAMLCRNRWGGLEQEGFGIVFLEAAACGVPQVAGSSGGAGDAVSHGETGLLVARPSDPLDVADALARLVDDPERRERMGEAARARALDDFGYDHLARQLLTTLSEAG